MFDHFNFLAPFYDHSMPFSDLERMLKMVDLPLDGLLLDAGGGTGRVASALRPYVRAALVADFSPGMLAQARRKGLTAIHTPAEHLPFGAGTFERIIMVDALHHVHNQAGTIAELWRVLRGPDPVSGKPGGRLVIEEPDVRTLIVKVAALGEKLALMRSHFLSPPKIAALFPPEAKVRIETAGYTAWVIVEK